MGMKAAVALLALVVLVVLLRGSLFGGGDDSKPSAARPGSIPTATPPNEMPTPVGRGETQTTSGTPAASAGGGTYVVKSGDTLGGIASQLGIAADNQAAWIAEVLRLNNIADARLLRVGVELRLPGTRATTATPTRASGSPTPTTTAAPTGTATPKPTVTGGAGTYTVVDGDYPLLIAEKLGVPEDKRDAWAQDLIELNDVDPTKLQVGQVLQLPAGTPSGGTTPTATPVP